MKRQVKIIPSYYVSNGVSLSVIDNRNMPISCLDCNHFLLMDDKGLISNPYACIEKLPGHYELTFKTPDMNKVRIKCYGYSTRFIKLK